MKVPWREASTLILTALKDKYERRTWNYEVLILQRSSKSSFWPDNFVFPGGITEATDSDRSWLDLFSDDIKNVNAAQISKDMPPLVKNHKGDIPKLLSLKIAAIRETFEETGVLLCTCKEDKRKSSEKWVSTLEINDSESWRMKVQKDPSEFLNLCLYHNCSPDVNNLYLWSNWLTPTNLTKRFDTAFFFASTKEQLLVAPDRKEIMRSKWFTPEELILLFRSRSICLPMPQFYEIRRLLPFKDIIVLKNIASSRSGKGLETIMSICFETSDGNVHVLPGDDAYIRTDITKSSESFKIKMTNKEFRAQSKVLHRIESSSKTGHKIFIKNYVSPYGHVLPDSD